MWLGRPTDPRIDAVIVASRTRSASSGAQVRRASSQASGRSAPAVSTDASPASGRISQTAASPWWVGNTPAKAWWPRWNSKPSQGTPPTYV